MKPPEGNPPERNPSESDSGRQSGLDLPWDLLDGYFTGTSSQAARARVDRWLDAAPSHRRELEAIRALWMRGPSATKGLRRWDTDRAIAEVERRMREPARTVSAPPTASTQRVTGFGSPARGPRTWRYLAGLTAAAVAGVAAGRLWHFNGHRIAPEALEQFSTAAHQRAEIILRDGTRLTLGPASRVRISPEFDRGSRALDLDGEALITVKHDASHPFEIRTAR